MMLSLHWDVARSSSHVQPCCVCNTHDVCGCVCVCVCKPEPVPRTQVLSYSADQVQGRVVDKLLGAERGEEGLRSGIRRQLGTGLKGT